ncbi:MAG: heme ABC transporter ATP-binding protein [bacterium]
MSTLLTAENISAGYQQRTVLHDVSLQVNSGEFLALVGANGSGKTTLLRVLSRVLKPKIGSVALNGKDLYHLSAQEAARTISFAPQEEAPVFSFPVREVVMMGRMPHQKGWGEGRSDRQVVEWAMEQAGVTTLADQPITALSGGERQRVTLARALAQQGKLLLLDEPMAHLDIGHQAAILQRLYRMVRQEGLGVVSALHDLNLAAEYADKIALLSKGKLVAVGTPQEVLQPELLHKAYGTPVMVRINPFTGKPAVFTLPAAPAQVVDASAPTIHVICGGASGVALFPSLREKGYGVTVGVTNLLDTDEEAARALGFEQAVENPYSAIGESALEEARALIQAAEQVVLTDIPFGVGNIANLKLAKEACDIGKKVWVLGEENFTDRDFCMGDAAILWRALLDNGAQRFDTSAELLQALPALN